MVNSFDNFQAHKHWLADKYIDDENRKIVGRWVTPDCQTKDTFNLSDSSPVGIHICCALLSDIGVC